MTVRLAMRFREVPMEGVGALIADDNVVFEQKMDGTRVLAAITSKGVEFRQSTGKVLAHTAATQHTAALADALKGLLDGPEYAEEIVLDGELMIRTGEYHVFDVPYAGAAITPMVTPGMDFRWRRWFLENAVAEMLPKGGPARVVRQARGPVAKQLMINAVNAAGAEGIIAKELDSPYEPGKRVKHTVKVKLVKTADVVVTAVDRPDPKHGSFTFGVIPFSLETLEAAQAEVPGVGPVHVMGKCSAIGKPAAKVGDVIEVAYLYREPSSGGLVQPRMMRVREDKSPAECTVDQFPIYSREVVEWDQF